jgi:hypothetical protein
VRLRSRVPHLAAAIAASARAAAAQPAAAVAAPASLPYAASLMAGVSQYDLSGTGTTTLLGVRVEAGLRRWLVAEAGLGFFDPNEQLGARGRYTVSELQLQLQWPGRVARPYVGAGGGYVIADGGRNNTGTASAAGGVRVALPGPRLDARGELRVRGVGSGFSGAAAEWLLGLGYRF